MKIIDKRKTKQVRFDELPVGTWLYYNESLYKKALMGEFNAIIIEEGTFVVDPRVKFANNPLVEQVDVEIHIL